MEIKSTGFINPELPEVGENSSSLESFSGVCAAFRRKDLENAAQRVSAIHQAVDELISREFPAASALASSQRRLLVDWLSNDPIVQARILSYLQRSPE